MQALIGATNVKLDLILAALGAISGGASIDTLELVIANQANSTRLVLQRIIDRLGYDLPQTLADDNQQIAKHLSDLVIAMYGTANPSGSFPPPILQNTEAIRQGYERVTGIDADADRTILYYISLLQAALGLPTGDATTTLLGLLTSIQYQGLYAQQGRPPTVADIGQCGTLATSTGTGDISGRTFARFADISGTDRRYTNTFTLPPYFEVSPPVGGNWTGWRAYVQSNAQSYFGNPSINISAPVNTWHDLSGDDNIPYAPSVAAGSYLKVYVCGPAAQTVYVINAVQATLSNGTVVWAIPWAGQLGVAGVSGNPNGGNSANQPIWGRPATDVNYVSTTAVTQYWGSNFQATIGANQTTRIGLAEDYVAIVGNGPFSITLTPYV